MVQKRHQEVLVHVFIYQVSILGTLFFVTHRQVLGRLWRLDAQFVAEGQLEPGHAGTPDVVLSGRDGSDGEAVLRSFVPAFHPNSL